MATSLEDDVRDTLESRLSNIPYAPSETNAVVQRVRRRRAANIVGVGLAVVLIGASVVAAPRAWDAVQAPDIATAAGGGAPQVAPPENERAVASGEHEGRPWTLYGYATPTSAAANEAGGDFCHAFRFGGESPGQDYLCGLGEHEALVPPQYIDPIWKTPDHGPEVFYGQVSPMADSVKIEIPDRQTLPARIYNSPAEWTAPYNLFVGFAPPGTDSVTLVVRDAQGNELERRTIEAAPQQ